jgi:hypothetical protein
MRTHDGPHGGDNHDPDCYGCVLKAKDLSYSSQAMPTRGRRQPFRPMQQPSWEAGVAGEHRPGGGFMPYLDGNLNEIGVKEMAENRVKNDGIRHRQLHDPNFS